MSTPVRAKRVQPGKPPGTGELAALRRAVTVLSEIVTHLAERVEILEARESLAHRKPSKA